MRAAVVAAAAAAVCLLAGCDAATQDAPASQQQQSGQHGVSPIDGTAGGSTGASAHTPGGNTTSGTTSGTSGAVLGATTSSSATATSTSSSSSTGTSGTTGSSSFQPASHQAFPSVPDHGGTLLDHPQLIAISYDSDPGRNLDEGQIDALATTNWLSDVGGEYGVNGASTYAKVHLGDLAPTQIDDAQITQMLEQRIQDGTVPAPSGALTEPLYVVFFPTTTTVTAWGATSCRDFLGYHASFSRGAYAVIPSCTQPAGSPLSEQEALELAVSHELFEAATDPVPFQGWVLTDSTSSWSYLGGELGDLCVDQGVQVDGHWMQRVWSNRAAAQGADPCVPANGEPYFSVSPSSSMVDVPAGGSVTIDVTGWSLADVSWNVSVYTSGGTFTPGMSWVQQPMTNGHSAQLTLSAPGAKSGDWSVVLLVSQRQSTDFNLWPVLVRVP